ncbi:MAG: T9SS type A sorting domain-containing protein [Bacteroidia bacterium]
MKKYLMIVSFIFHLNYLQAQNNFAKLITQPPSYAYGVLVKAKTNREFLVLGLKSEFKFSYLLDSLGNLKWSHKYFIPTTSISYQTNIFDFAFTEDNGFMAVGGTPDQTTYKEGITLIKFDSLGRISWTKRFLHTFESVATAIINVAGNKFAICAQTLLLNNQEKYRAINFTLIDSAGNIINSKRIGSDSMSFVPHQMKALGSGYIIEGEWNMGTKNNYSTRYFLLKINSSGQVIKAKTLNIYNYYKGVGITVTHDNKILYSFGNGINNAFTIMKLDEDLNISWCKKIIGGGGNRLDLTKLEELQDSTYLLYGEVGLSSSGGKPIGCKLDTSGNVIKGFTINYTNHEYGNQAVTSGNKILFQSLSDPIPGGPSSDFFVTSDYDFNGLCMKANVTLSLVPFTVTDSLITLNRFSNYLNVTIDTIPYIDTLLDYTFTDLCPSSAVNENSSEPSIINIFPIPVNSILRVKLSNAKDITILNLLGDVVLKKDFRFNVNEMVQVDASSLPSGIYFLKAGTVVTKFIKE